MERQAQVDAEVVEHLRVGVGGATHKRARFQAGADEHRCLQPNHFNVFVFSDIRPLLKLHIIHLPLADLLRRAGEQFGYLAETVALGLMQNAERLNQHCVARQNGRVVAVFGGHRGLSATDGRAVHNVVVQQREVVEHFPRNGGRVGVGNLASVKHLAGQNRQQRTDAFSAVAH